MAKQMKLGLGTGYWSSGPPAGIEETIAMAEDLGYDSMWAAEAYGSDAITPLAWWGAKTKKIKLGTSIAQISARQPAALAMAAMTLDHLSGGRVILGIGASGPQVVEGWYGEPYPKPLERTREYVSILRKIFKREERVEFHGKHYQLPYEGGMGLGKALKSTLHPFRPDIPVFLAAEGPKNVALAAEIADGWLPLFFTPKMDKFYRDALAEGLRQAGRAPQAGRLRGGGDGDDHRDERHRGRRAVHQADAGAVHGRHGRPRRELPPRRVRADGLGRRREEGAGPVPGRQEGRGGQPGARRAGAGRGADRPARQDQGRAGGVERDLPDDDDGGGAAADDEDGGGAGAGLGRREPRTENPEPGRREM